LYRWSAAAASAVRWDNVSFGQFHTDRPNEPVSVTGGRCEPGVAKLGNVPGPVEFYR
jgi:hypothetical protein